MLLLILLPMYMLLLVYAACVHAITCLCCLCMCCHPSMLPMCMVSLGCPHPDFTCFASYCILAFFMLPQSHQKVCFCLFKLALEHTSTYLCSLKHVNIQLQSFKYKLPHVYAASRALPSIYGPWEPVLPCLHGLMSMLTQIRLPWELELISLGCFDNALPQVFFGVPWEHVTVHLYCFKMHATLPQEYIFAHSHGYEGSCSHLPA